MNNSTTFYHHKIQTGELLAIRGPQWILPRSTGCLPLH